MISTLAPGTAVPSVGAWRRRARRARRAHHRRPVGDLLTDLYTLICFFLIYGSVVGWEVRRYLANPALRAASPEQHWITVAALLLAAGLVWRGLHALGPMLATPAEQSWSISSPLDRAAWLKPRFIALLLAGATAGAIAVSGVAVFGFLSIDVGLSVWIGTLYGLLIAAGSVVAQATGGTAGWPRLLESALLGVGGLLAVALVAAHSGGRSIPGAIGGSGPPILVIGAGMAIVGTLVALRCLPRLDRAALGSGAWLAAAVVTSAVWMDATVLSNLLEARRWRRVGRVRSRRLIGVVPGLPRRLWALIQLDALRTTRRPGSLVVFAGLALAVYGVAIAAPGVAGAARLVLAYLAAGRLMAGLRTIAQSSTFRRALGGSDAILFGAHLVVPTLATFIWWLVTESAVPDGRGVVGLALAATVVAASYRKATRPPLIHGGMLVETPVGLVPIEFLLQLARGPDLLGLAIVIELLLR